MPWQDPTETIIAGSGGVYVADLGAALPANESSALSPATWTGLGYHTEDGVSVSSSPNVTEHGAWQARRPIRIQRGADDFRVTFTLQQWNEVTVPLAFGGGEVVDLGSGHYRYNPPADDAALDEKAAVIDVIDGDTIGRFVIERAVAVEAVEASFNDESIAGLPITLRALEPQSGGDGWFFLTNADGFVTGS